MSHPQFHPSLVASRLLIRRLPASLSIAALVALGCAGPLQATPEADPKAVAIAPGSPDFAEVHPAPEPGRGLPPVPAAVGPIAPASGQPAGALSGRIVFMNGGHGWAAGSSSWALGRPLLLEMNEDYGNVDQMSLFAIYCFNAGATVVPFRPIGNQTNEVVLDNDDAGVTFAGAWSDSTSTIFFGSPGDVPYRFASLAASETATATYAPNLPAAGFYPVYTWARHGSDRTSQLYRIRHTGGESLVRVPHHMVGNGWVYLGTYYFDAGSNPASGAVVISNLQPSPSVGSVVIADAIRFGNGMGNVDRGFGVSTYPREEECARYWVQSGLGQGQSPTLYDPDYPASSTDDDSDNVGVPPRMAREMNREAEGNIFKRILISFHSNAGGSRGVVGLWNDNANFPGTGTPNQYRLAQLCGTEVNSDLVGIGAPPLEVAWFNRGSSITTTQTFAFGEIRADSLGNEMDATIIEVAFHDDANDALLLRDPKARNWIARASYQAVLRYMNEFDSAPLTFLPEPPGNVRAIATTNGIVVSWAAPVAQAGSGSASGYVVYRSTDGYGFGNPVNVSGGAGTSLTMTNLPAESDYYFRVAATNTGGESVPSETAGCRRPANSAIARILVVNAFDRFERRLNLRQTPTGNYRPPGHDNNSGVIDRVLPRGNNAFDYIVPHGKAITAFGLAFDSCQNEAVANGLVPLTNYPIVIWACGNESSTDETFSSTEQSKVGAFLAAGGHLFVSGSEVAWDLDRDSGPTTADRAFLNNQLHADLNGNANDDSGIYTFAPAAGSIFAGNTSGDFDDGSKGIYAVGFPDVLTPTGSGAVAAIDYSGGGAAAVQYDGSAGGGRVVYLGFPFETITSPAVRNAYLADILGYFLAAIPAPLRFDAAAALPDRRFQFTLTGKPGTYRIEISATLTNWSTLAYVTNQIGVAGYMDDSATNSAMRFYRAVQTQ